MFSLISLNVSPVSSSPHSVARLQAKAARYSRTLAYWKRAAAPNSPWHSIRSRSLRATESMSPYVPSPTGVPAASLDRIRVGHPPAAGWSYHQVQLRDYEAYSNYGHALH